MACQASINVGAVDRVRDLLVEDVTSIFQYEAGNKQLLLALAQIEEPEKFLPRLDALELRHTVDFAARHASQFFWGDANTKESLIPIMLRKSNDGELVIIPTRYMFENARLDLLQEYRLVRPQPDPFDTYSRYPGWDQMTRPERAHILGKDLFDELERKRDEPVVMMDPLIRASVECWGFSVKQSGDRLLLEGPG